MTTKLRGMKLRGSRSAVSEIIGNILILGVTVSLFTGVMAFVSDIPEPPEPLRADFYAELRHDLLHITHSGGSELSSVDVLITVTADGKSSTFQLSEGMFTHGGLTSTWMQGDVWVLDLTANQGRFQNADVTFIPNSLKITISHLSLPEPLWSKTLKSDEPQPAKLKSFALLDSAGKANQVIDSDGRRVWAINAGENFRIRVEIETPSQVTVQLVRADLGSLYGGSSTVTLSNIGGGAYQFASVIAPTSAVGWHNIRLTIVDSDGNQIQESRTIVLRDKSSEGGLPPVDPEEPDPEVPDPEGPIVPEDPDPDDGESQDPGMSSSALVNDLYFLTPTQWSAFASTNGASKVHDTYAVEGDEIVLAFKASALTGLPIDRTWGAAVTGAPHLNILVYRTSDGALLENKSAGTNINSLSLGGTLWHHYTLELSPAAQAALGGKGIFIKFEVRLSTNDQHALSANPLAVAYSNFHKSTNQATKVWTYDSNGQARGVFEIGESVYIAIRAPDAPIGEPTSAVFRGTSLHDPSLSREVGTEYIGATGSTLLFRMETFEAAGIYLSNSSFFVHCDSLSYSHEAGSNTMKVSAKIYLEEGAVVEGGGSLQNTINSAQPGDTIRVHDSTIPGGLIVDKPLTIYGNSSTISAPVLGPTLTISSEGTDIRGFKVDATSEWHSGATVIVSGSPNSQFSDNEISTRSPDGNQISVSNSPGFKVNNNTIRSMGGHSAISLTIINSPDSEIIGNNITGSTNNAAGQIKVEGSDRVTVKSNTMTASNEWWASTIHVLNSEDVSIIDNTINGATSNTECQIEVEGSGGVIIKNNSMNATSTDGSVTIRILNSEDVSIIDNTIYGNTDKAARQIDISGSDRVTVKNNSMNATKKDNSVTIRVSNSSDDVSIIDNTISGDTGSAASQIGIDMSDAVIVENNTMNATKSYGSITMDVSYSNDVTIEDNTISGDTGNADGQIKIEGSARVRVSGNTMNAVREWHVFTIQVLNSNDVSLTDNSILGLTGNAASQIRIQKSNGSSIVGNIIHESSSTAKKTVHITNSDYTFSGNVIKGSSSGLESLYVTVD